jgi:hypothetical protein
MSIVVGDKSGVALELEPEVEGQYLENTNLFLYLKGVKFGEPNCDYPMYVFVDHVIEYYQKSKISFPELFKCSAKLIIEAIEAFNKFEYGAENECEKGVFDSPILKFAPTFEENFDEIDKCIFRYAGYAFDHCLLVIVPSGEKIKICIRDDDTEKYKDVVSTYEEFYGLWVELKSAIDKKKSAL